MIIVLKGNALLLINFHICLLIKLFFDCYLRHVKYEKGIHSASKLFTAFKICSPLMIK